EIEPRAVVADHQQAVPRPEAHGVDSGREGEDLRKDITPRELPPDAAIALAHGDAGPVRARVVCKERDQGAAVQAGMLAWYGPRIVRSDLRIRVDRFGHTPFRPHGAPSFRGRPRSQRRW